MSTDAAAHMSFFARLALVVVAALVARRPSVRTPVLGGVQFWGKAPRIEIPEPGH